MELLVLTPAKGNHKLQGNRSTYEVGGKQIEVEASVFTKVTDDLPTVSVSPGLYLVEALVGPSLA